MSFYRSYDLAFTKALICLSKYGDELSIYATPDTLSLSATNSSKSAYCRFKYERQFFSKYKVGAETWGDDVEDVGNLTGQILVKVRLGFSLSDHARFISPTCH